MSNVFDADSNRNEKKWTPGGQAEENYPPIISEGVFSSWKKNNGEMISGLPQSCDKNKILADKRS